MADYVSGYTTPPSGGPGYRIHLYVTPGAGNIAGNYTPVSWSAYLEMAYSWGGFYAYDSSSGSVVINGSTVLSIPSSTPASAWDVSLYLGGGTVNVPHNADGTKTLSFSASFNGGGSGYAPGYMGLSNSMVLTPIPRATTPTVSPTSGETGQAFTINHAPATSTFYHDIAYSLDGGTTYTNIATNVPGTTTSTPWTPPHTLLPNSSSVTAVIRVITRSSSGGTITGERTVNLPLTVPASVRPSVSGVTWTDAQTSGPDMPTLMGGAGRFVQGWSRLLPTVAASGASGSSITGTSVTLGPQTTTSGVAFGAPVSLSGTVPFSATATDTRGRTSPAFTDTVTVKAYSFPNLPTPSVQRTSDAAGNVPSPAGTYLAITPAASVSDLTFGGAQKNLLEYRIRTRPVGGAFTTVQDWTSTGVSGNTWTSKRVAAGPYAANTEYIVEVSIRDVFGKNGFNTGNTVVVREMLVRSEAVAFDWDEGEGLGVNKYRQEGYALDVSGAVRFDSTLDIGGVGTQDRGSGPKRLLDVDDITPLASSAETIAGTLTTKAVTPAGLALLTATDARRGLVELATNAETLAGTATDLAVTPAGLAARSISRNEWTPAIPTNVAYGGVLPTVDADGRITMPQGITWIRLDGCIREGYEYDIRLHIHLAAAGAAGIVFRTVKAGATNVSTSYNLGGWYGQYNGVYGNYNTGGNTFLPFGELNGGGSSTYMTGSMLVFPGANPIVNFIGHGTGFARSFWGGGYGGGAAPDGIYLALVNGSAFRGTLHLYERKMTAA